MCVWVCVCSHFDRSGHTEWSEIHDLQTTHSLSHFTFPDCIYDNDNWSWACQRLHAAVDLRPVLMPRLTFYIGIIYSTCGGMQRVCVCVDRVSPVMWLKPSRSSLSAVGQMYTMSLFRNVAAQLRHVWCPLRGTTFGEMGQCVQFICLIFSFRTFFFFFKQLCFCWC